MGCSKLLVESDCMEVVEAMQQGGNSIGPGTATYEECTFLCRKFTYVIFARCAEEGISGKRRLK